MTPLITFADIIRAVDGPLALTPCTSRTAYQRCEDCVDEATCAIRKTLVRVRDANAAILESQTILEAAEAARTSAHSGKPQEKRSKTAT